MPTSYGLNALKKGDRGHAVVVLHGLSQRREHLEPLALQIAAKTKGPAVFSYGYNHTHHLVTNGEELAKEIERHIPKGRVDLVGYSMGGLIARLAATDRHPSRVHTVVTLATPNRGSLSNAELTRLGQLARETLFISPIAPRSDGVRDLTRAAEIMAARRETLLKENADFKGSATTRRYVSIPALFYHPHRPVYALGPSFKMALFTMCFEAIRAKWGLGLLSLARPNDGIVTEQSNDLTLLESHDWSEIRLFDADGSGHPARCHAVVDACRDHDHMSILQDDWVAELIAALISCADWRTLKADWPRLRNRIHIKPFDEA